ncbi:hypothetical protein FACUT_5678 [Fusarium acutatum]|uniref:Uncharacterized protein n=1 Tax=Fusarium acutatum TaxID=78861 RepID=A0A8H4NJJ3_9HYPO|nr:hypothetical protein FACUT_5678 [Fusarium acutatum]
MRPQKRRFTNCCKITTSASRFIGRILSRAWATQTWEQPLWAGAESNFNEKRMHNVQKRCSMEPSCRNIFKQLGPKSQKNSRGNGPSKSLPSRPATRATSKSFLPVSAAPTSFTIETSSPTVSFLTVHYPDDWIWDPAKPGKYRAAFEARTKHIKSDYASRVLVIGPDLTQRLDEMLTPLSQPVPSPHPYSDIRGIPKIDDVFDTDNPVKSSTNIFMTGMIASSLAVKVMPGEELVNGTLPSKDLVELTMPMTEEEKQQVQQEKGPKYYWQRGRLTGANGAAEAGISDPSCAFFPPSEMDPSNRSATCSSHLQQYPRPTAVGVGWGGFDRFREWQLHGRQVKRDVVEYEPFSKEPKSTLDFVTKTGELTMTIPMDIEDFKPEPSLLKTSTL